MLVKLRHNPFRIPFSQNEALEHRSATTSGHPSQLNSSRCACCLQPIQRNSLSINFSPQDLTHLPVQYKYFFILIKIIGLFILFILFDTGISQLQDIFRNNTQNFTFMSNKWSSLSPSYPSEKFWLYSSLSFVSIAFSMFLTRVYITYKLRMQKNLRIGQQNFSILLKNIPKSINVQEKIMDLFKMNFDNLHIKQIILISNMEKYNLAKKSVQKSVNQWRKLLMSKQKRKQSILASLKQIQVETKKLQETRRQIREQKNQNFSGNAIVVFSTIQNRQQIMKAWKIKFFTHNKLQASFGNSNLQEKQTIILQQAPLPEQIEWQNISCSESQNKAYVRLNSILNFLVFVVLFLLYFLAQLMIGRKIGQNLQFVSYSSLAPLVLLSVISHSLLPWIINFLQLKEKPNSLTNKNRHRLIKYALLLLLTRSLVFYFTQTSFSQRKQAAFSTINTIIVFTFVDLIISILFWLINPHDLIKKGKKLIFNKRNALTQGEANYLFQKSSHNLIFKYGFLLTAFWTSVMFCNLAPICIMVQFTSVFIFYWIDKLNFAKRSSVSSKRMSISFVENYLNLMQICLVLKPLANLLFWGTAKQELPIPEIIMLASGLIYNVVSKNFLVQKILKYIKCQQKNVDKNYSQELMSSLYRIENPITGGLQQKIRFLQETKGEKFNINEQASQISCVNMSHSFTNGKDCNTIQDKVQLQSRPSAQAQTKIGNNEEQDHMQKVENIDKNDQCQQGTDRNMVNM